MGAGLHFYLCNGTPYTWKRLSSKHDNMSTDDEEWFEEVKPFDDSRVYIEFSTGHSGYSTAIFEIQCPGSPTFGISASNSSGWIIAVSPLTVSFLNHPNNGVPLIFPMKFMGRSPWYFDGNSFIISGLESAFVCSSQGTFSSWMQTFLPRISSRNLRSLCLPASHDSGMSRLTNSTFAVPHGAVCTQSTDIDQQLERGVRMFDIRPCLWNQVYYTGHFSGSRGGTGMEIRQIVDQINTFTRDHSELIILNVSHDLNTDNSYKTFTEQDWEGLFVELDRLNHLYAAESASVDLSQFPMSKFIGNGTSAVVIRLQDNHSWGNNVANLKHRAGKGFFLSDCLADYTDEYSDTDDSNALMADQFEKLVRYRSDPASPTFNLNWALTPTAGDIVGGAVLTNWADEAMTPRLGPYVLRKTTKTRYPNFIDADNVNTTDLLAICLALIIQAISD